MMATGTRRESGVLVFDGDCSFCTSSARVAGRIVPTARIVPWQRADLDALGVDREAAAEAIQWVDSHGQVSAGADAVARMLRTGALIWRVLGALMLLPGIRELAGVVYRLVANNRHRLPGGTPACRVG
jgi:predicted DCC family thiol-disulfide oxidoreductase YuxK